MKTSSYSRPRTTSRSGLHLIAFAIPLAIPLLLTASSSTLAATWVVHPDGSGDFATIQAAVGAAASGDAIELTDGTFTGNGNRDVDFVGKGLSIRSQSGNPENCVIDCEGSAADPHRAFYLEDALTHISYIEGITVRGGEAPENGFEAGGAIFCYNAPMRVARCHFRENRARAGGAISTISPAVIVEECLFVDNVAEEGGGAVVSALSLDIIRCTFARNSASWDGSAIAAFDGDTRIDGCTFLGNHGPSTLLAIGTPPGSGRVTVANSILAFGDGVSIACHDAAGAEIACSDVYGNADGDWVECIASQAGQDGNFSEDPLFCAAQSGDFTLASGSPCAPDNNVECGLVGAWPVGCDITPVKETSWGRIKRTFSPDASRFR